MLGSGQMGAVFWSGLIIGGILSLVGSILANLYTNKIYLFVGSHIKKFAEKRKSKELRKFYLITLLFKNEINQSAFFVSRSLFIVSYMIAGLFFSNILFMLQIPINLEPENVSKMSFTLERITSNFHNHWPKVLLLSISFVVSSASLIRAAIYFRQYFDIWHRLDTYRAYRGQIHSQWPNEVAEI
jgi:hypothetical protein